MEKTRICPNGKQIKFKMTKGSGLFTKHIWVSRNGLPYLHVLQNPKNNNSVLVFKNCIGYGYLSIGELFIPWENLTLEKLWTF